jgi:arginine:agmatine antiporter
VASVTQPEAAAVGAARSGHPALGLPGATALVTGSMIGSGIFLLPATLGPMGSISLLGWVAATVAALALAGTFAWLGAVAPEATGLPAYVRAALGRYAGGQCAFLYWLQGAVGNVGLAVAAAGALAYFIPALGGPGARLTTTLGAIWLAVAACAVGPRLVSRIEGVTLAAGLAPVLLIALFGWFWFHPSVFASSWNPGHLSAPAAVWRSGLVVFWAFLGVECAAAVAGVVRDPQRNVPRATLLGVAGAAALYIGACTVLMGLVPAARLANSTAPFADAAQVTIGVGGAALIAFCGLLRTAGCFAGWTLVTAETARTAADEGVFPRVLRTRPGERASGRNLLLLGVLTSIVAVATASPTLAAQFKLIVDVAVILSLFAYIFAALALLRLLRRLPRAAHRWSAAGAAGLAIVCSVALVASGDRTELLWSFGVLALSAALSLAFRTR